MQGKIVKGIAGFYYVHTPDGSVYECKAKGIFRNNHQKPLVGDDVKLDILNETEKLGNITAILPRKNELIRPAVANVDQALVIFSVVKPAPNLNLLDRFLIFTQQKHLSTIICFNKKDIATETEEEKLRSIYENCGYTVLFVSAKEGIHLDKLQALLKGKTTTVAGPSGVGKSSIINCLQKNVRMETGSISEKIERGKHTTRHSEIIAIDENTYIVDTPGFSSMDVFDMEKEDLQQFYPEFVSYEKNCKFAYCSHIHEPVCGVKEALSKGLIGQERYDSYVQIYEELKGQKKY